MPGQTPLLWLIREVTPRDGATIEMQLDGAVLSFEWRFAGLADARTRITQRVVLRGEKADEYVSHAKVYATNLPDGMKKLATAMADADASRKSAGR